MARLVGKKAHFDSVHGLAVDHTGWGAPGYIRVEYWHTVAVGKAQHLLQAHHSTTSDP